MANLISERECINSWINKMEVDSFENMENRKVPANANDRVRPEWYRMSITGCDSQQVRLVSSYFLICYSHMYASYGWNIEWHMSLGDEKVKIVTDIIRRKITSSSNKKSFNMLEAGSYAGYSTVLFARYCLFFSYLNTLIKTAFQSPSWEWQFILQWNWSRIPRSLEVFSKSCRLAR